MAFCELKYFSPALGKQTAANIILPECGDNTGPYPVFYLLHGLSDDHSIWMRRTSIERYVSDLPLIVVMPDGGRGFYCDAAVGCAYETAVMRDLIGYVDKMFPTRAERSGRCIGGLSMGGYGAVSLALKHPDMFCSANSHSGAVGWGHGPLTGHGELDVEFQRILGDHPEGGPNDCFAIVEKIDKSLMPALRIDCGTDDFLIESNREFHSHLQQLSIEHEYEEFPGSHEWGYWDVHIQQAIAFHRRSLNI